MSRSIEMLWVVVLAPALHAQWAEVEIYPQNVDGTVRDANDSGAVVGYHPVASPGGSHEFRLDGSGFAYLEALPHTTFATVRAIDDAGIAYGSSIDGGFPNINYYATRWIGTTPQAISSLVTSGANLALHTGFGASATGTIVGTARLPGSNTVDRGFVLKNGVLTEIFDSSVLDSAIPTGIGPNDVVVGFGSTGGNGSRAWTWQAGTFTLLPLPLLPHVTASASAINASGQVCGHYTFTNDPLTNPAYPRAASWKNGVFTDLDAFGEALAINAAGDIVGYVNNDLETAVLWRNGEEIILQSIVPANFPAVLERALAIADDGTIYGKCVPGGGFRLRLCAGGFQKLGFACGGTLPAPKLDPGAGCPDPGKTMSLEISGALPNAVGILLIGAGNGPLPFKPSCTIGVAPLLPVSIPILVSSAGKATLSGSIPAPLAPVTVFTQLLLADPLGAGGAVASEVLRIDIG